MFQDLKVIELASVLAGPSVGQFFAELGAEVIKVENLKTGGDVTRTWKLDGELEGDLSAYFCSCNWGKKSVAIDLTDRKGKEVMMKLAATADIIIASFKPGDAEKLGVAYDQIKKNNQSIIYGQINGYGANNDRVGYDAVIQAEAGFMDMNGEEDGPPIKMPVALIDILAGHQLKEGLLMAMLQREKTGDGSLVEVSLIQTAIASLANQATNWLVAHKLPERRGSAHPNIAPYGEAFETRDGKQVLLAVGTDRQFYNLMNVLGHGPLVALPNFATNESRVINRQQLNKILKTSIKEWSSTDLMKELHHHKIPAGLIQNVKEALDMPEAQELLLHSAHVTGVRSFAAVSPHWVVGKLRQPPHLGEHTIEVLSGLS